jgi:transposase
VVLKQLKSKKIMTYPADFRAQVIKSVKQQGMSIRQACAFYDISKATLQNWLKDPSIKLTRNKPPSKIHNDALLKDVEQYPDDYLHERAQRLSCSKSGIEAALKRLGISKKKDLSASKSMLNKEI